MCVILDLPKFDVECHWRSISQGVGWYGLYCGIFCWLQICLFNSFVAVFVSCLLNTILYPLSTAAKLEHDHVCLFRFCSAHEDASWTYQFHRHLFLAVLPSVRAVRLGLPPQLSLVPRFAQGCERPGGETAEVQLHGANAGLVGRGWTWGWGWSWLGFPEMIQKWLCHGKAQMDDDWEKALFQETTISWHFQDQPWFDVVVLWYLWMCCYDDILLVSGIDTWHLGFDGSYWIRITVP